MKLSPSNTLSEEQVQSGLKLVIKDGLCTESMNTVISGAFLVAMALEMGASNFQIGLLAALPTVANVFQLLSVWLVQRYNNRRAISVICSLFARFPLLAVGVLPFYFSAGTSINVMIFLLFFHYFFGAISGASWNSWMKDLVPSAQLGSYFSHRTRLMQTLSVALSIGVAYISDFVKARYPQYEMITYSTLFMFGGVLGLAGAFILSRTPEPLGHLKKEQLFSMMKKPMRDKNYRKLMIFNSCWSFSLNLAIPFFSVYMMKALGLTLSTIIILNIISQLSSIIFIKSWGRYSDRFSNKTIIRICAPLYIGCIIAWSFTNIYSITIPLLIIIQVLSGIATGGINLSVSNIGLKLAPKNEAIVYLVAKNMATAFIPALAPVFGGLIADFFITQQFSWFNTNTHTQPSAIANFLQVSNWSFFFVLGALLAALSLRLLKAIKEDGEQPRTNVYLQMKDDLGEQYRQFLRIPAAALRIYRPVIIPLIVKYWNQRRG